MQYIRVKWLHSNPDEPVLLFSELDKGRYEIRKVEIFADGRIGFACSKEETQSTRLSYEPVPSLNEIASDPQFEPGEISAVEFETVWKKRKHLD